VTEEQELGSANHVDQQPMPEMRRDSLDETIHHLAQAHLLQLKRGPEAAFEKLWRDAFLLVKTSDKT